MTTPDSEGSVEAARADEPWTVMRLIRWSAAYLEGKGVERPRLDVELLLGDALDLSRLDLYLQFDRPLTPPELAAFKERLLRRARREPVQYILGRTSFRELELLTDERVLIPRPETEVLVERVLEWARERAGRWGADLSALEIGTGSGAIALSLAVEGPFRNVVAGDTSPEALELAHENLERIEPPVPVDFREGSLYTVVQPGERFDIVVSNPPYVPREDRESLQPEIREWEPEEALLAGPEGLEVLREIVRGAPEVMAPGGLLALEVGEGQARAVSDLMTEAGRFSEPRIVRDLAGHQRIVLAETPAGGHEARTRHRET